MSNITDANGKPLESTPPKPQTAAGNGKSTGEMDVRTIPTGTLIWNLFLRAWDEKGMGMGMMQLEQLKAQQAMVADPPQLAELREQLKLAEHERFVLANELNVRFRDVDKARVDELGLELIDRTLGEPDEKSD